MTKYHNRLKSVVFDSEGLNLEKERAKGDTSDSPNYDVCLQEADNIVNNIRDVSVYSLRKSNRKWHLSINTFIPDLQQASYRRTNSRI